MCSVFGAILFPVRTATETKVNRILSEIFIKSLERGRDGYGYALMDSVGSVRSHKNINPNADLKIERILTSHLPVMILGNFRAEPTTEYVQVKQEYDQQPYRDGTWVIVHNGTIANDKELKQYEVDSKIDSAVIPQVLSHYAVHDANTFAKALNRVKGSYAIIAKNIYDVKTLFVGCNYRPIWYIKTDVGMFFASSRDYFPKKYSPKMVQPYTANTFTVRDRDILHSSVSLYPTIKNHKALVVCSGGLDSVVSAVYAQKVLGYEIELIHFLYGSRAEGPEVEAITKVSEYLGCKLKLFPLPVYKPGDSPLLDKDSTVAGGEAGAEFAHEWVPARNLLLLSVATAYAEANGFTKLVLGNNLEEAGAYPDNEPEFIAKFNDLLPFAIGDGKQLEVVMPVGNMMKHEIVKLGVELDAPLHLTWSCYRAGELHCGKCGPCFMRKTAFEINNIPEVIKYVHD